MENDVEPAVGAQLRIGPIRSAAELKDLWGIDKAAYGQASLTYEQFADWWSSFPLGLWTLFSTNRIAGAIGIWPLSVSCADLLKSGRLKESDLTGRMMRPFTTRTARCWYVSGVVLLPELEGSRAIRLLFSRGIGSWLRRTRIAFPCELLALASSSEGERLLEGFEFFKIQNATAMPDHVPLFGLRLGTREQLVSLLKGRGLELD